MNMVVTLARMTESGCHRVDLSGAARPIGQGMINDGVGADDIPWSDEERSDGVRLSSSRFARSPFGAVRPIVQGMINDGVGAAE